jgi:hypothetical protein
MTIHHDKILIMRQCPDIETAMKIRTTGSSDFRIATILAYPGNVDIVNTVLPDDSEDVKIIQMQQKLCKPETVDQIVSETHRYAVLMEAARSASSTQDVLIRLIDRVLVVYEEATEARILYEIVKNPNCSTAVMHHIYSKMYGKVSGTSSVLWILKNPHADEELFKRVYNSVDLSSKMIDLILKLPNCPESIHHLHAIRNTINT